MTINDVDADVCFIFTEFRFEANKTKQTIVTPMEKANGFSILLKICFSQEQKQTKRKLNTEKRENEN